MSVDDGISVRKWAYLSIFFLCQYSTFSSIGQVSSAKLTTLEALLMKTRSGFRAVTVISGGMEPPPGAWKPGISL